MALEIYIDMCPGPMEVEGFAPFFRAAEGQLWRDGSFLEVLRRILVYSACHMSHLRADQCSQLHKDRF
jgi:hypothetical protein